MKEQPKHAHQRDYDEVYALLLSDADIRLATMLGVGYIERYLVDALAYRLPGLTPDFKKTFFKRTVRGVGARIDLAQATRFITADIADQLRALVEIRNIFAHNVSARDCDHTEVRSLIGKLHIAQKVAADSRARGTHVDDTEIVRMMIAGGIRTIKDNLDRRL